MSALSPRFPYKDQFTFGDKTLTSKELLELLTPYLTPDRQRKIAETVARRTCNVVPVFENLYDRGNVSAVLRSAEGLGYQCAHVIESGEKFKEANRVTQGADKWVDVKKWRTTGECVKELRNLGYQILVTHLDANAVSIADVDVTKPTALVFGNERDGVTPEMIASADKTVIIPMQGFVQSFNISVAAAIGLYHIYNERMQKLGHHGDLSDLEQSVLRAEFSLRSSKNPERLVEEIVSRSGVRD